MAFLKVGTWGRGLPCDVTTARRGSSVGAWPVSQAVFGVESERSPRDSYRSQSIGQNVLLLRGAAIRGSYVCPGQGMRDRRSRCGKHDALSLLWGPNRFYHHWSEWNRVTSSLKKTTQSPIKSLHPAHIPGGSSDVLIFRFPSSSHRDCLKQPAIQKTSPLVPCTLHPRLWDRDGVSATQTSWRREGWDTEVLGPSPWRNPVRQALGWLHSLWVGTVPWLNPESALQAGTPCPLLP